MNFQPVNLGSSALVPTRDIGGDSKVIRPIAPVLNFTLGHLFNDGSSQVMLAPVKVFKNDVKMPYVSTRDLCLKTTLRYLSSGLSTAHLLEYFI